MNTNWAAGIGTDTLSEGAGGAKLFAVSATATSSK